MCLDLDTIVGIVYVFRILTPAQSRPSRHGGKRLYNIIQFERASYRH